MYRSLASLPYLDFIMKIIHQSFTQVENTHSEVYWFIIINFRFWEEGKFFIERKHMGYIWCRPLCGRQYAFQAIDKQTNKRIDKHRLPEVGA